MKAWLTILAALCVFLCAFQYVSTTYNSGATATTVIYKNNCSGSGSGTSYTCTFVTTTPTAGNAVLINVSNLGTSNSVSSFCDDTAGTCAGSHSTYTTVTYANGTTFENVTGYTCVYAGNSATVTVTLASSAVAYVVGVFASGNRSNCLDGSSGTLFGAQATTGTAYTSGTVTTTNANDLLIGIMSNNCGVTSFTAGSDGQSGTYTERIDNTFVTMIETLGETSTNTYSAGGTGGTSCHWNAQVFPMR